MNVKELRIGNLISHSSGKTLIVDEIHNVGAMASFLSEKGSVTAGVQFFEPIPITAEWLERLGFSFNRSVAVFDEFQKGNIVYMVWKNGRKDLGLDTNVVSYGNKHIKCQFVHQLQNLYYALCGEELTLKTESK